LPEKRESWPVRLACSGARSPAADRTGDNRCPLEERGGERRQRALSARTRHRRRLKSAFTIEDTSFARSRDPCTSIVTQLSTRKRWEVARSVRYRGRANLRKQEEPAPRSERTDASAARRVSPLLSRRPCVMRKKRKVVMAIVPARKRESRRGVRTSCSVAEVGRQHPGLE